MHSAKLPPHFLTRLYSAKRRGIPPEAAGKCGGKKEFTGNTASFHEQNSDSFACERKGEEKINNPRR